jgi:hypothetical protein
VKTTMFCLESGIIMKGKIEDNACAEGGSFLITGMITGSLEVKANADLTLRGMVCEDVITYDGSKLLVYGMINGSLFIKGGIVEVYGMVCGDVVNEGGELFLHKDAKILGNLHE